MTNPLNDAFCDSLDRCLLAPGFLPRFYELFLASSPEVRAKFEQTDFVRQTRMLRASLHMVLAASYGAPEATSNLARLGALHSKAGRDIPPHLYELWLTSLITAAKEHDPEWDSGLETEWREMLMPGIRLLVAAYDSSPGHAAAS